MLKKILIFIMPWSIRRILLNKWMGYQIAPNTRIGKSWVYPEYLEMQEGAKIGHFTVAIHLDKIILGKNSTIGNFNWITGFPSGTKSQHFAHQADRQSIFEMAEESAITKHHHIDCTSKIHIGAFTTIAGYYTQFLTHSINIEAGIQDSTPITIGDYCFVSTNCVILGGSELPNYSVLGAKSLLNKQFINEYTLYGGVPAKEIKALPSESKYFHRSSGFVY